MIFQQPINRNSMAIHAYMDESRPTQNLASTRNKSFQPLNVSELFKLSLERFTLTVEKKEQESAYKVTAFKALFVSLLVLGIVCAASFFLLPILGQIAAGLGLSVATTTTIWQAIFLGGGLLTGFSFIPRHFIQGFEKERLKYQQQLTLLKNYAREDYFREFLDAEFHGKYRHPRIILETPELAELYFYSKNLSDKRLKFQQLENQLFQIQQLLKPSNLAKEEVESLNKQIPYIRNLLQGVSCEIEEVENHIQRLRHSLIRIDQN